MINPLFKQHKKCGSCGWSSIFHEVTLRLQVLAFVLELIVLLTENVNSVFPLGKTVVEQSGDTGISVFLK